MLGGGRLPGGEAHRWANARLAKLGAVSHASRHDAKGGRYAAGLRARRGRELAASRLPCRSAGLSAATQRAGAAAERRDRRAEASNQSQRRGAAGYKRDGLRRTPRRRTRRRGLQRVIGHGSQRTRRRLVVSLGRDGSRVSRAERVHQARPRRLAAAAHHVLDRAGRHADLHLRPRLPVAMLRERDAARWARAPPRAERGRALVAARLGVGDRAAARWDAKGKEERGAWRRARGGGGGGGTGGGGGGGGTGGGGGGDDGCGGGGGARPQGVEGVARGMQVVGGGRDVRPARVRGRRAGGCDARAAFAVRSRQT